MNTDETDTKKKNNRRGRRGTQRRFLGDFSALLCVLCGSNFFRLFEGRFAESRPPPRPTLFASAADSLGERQPNRHGA
jgi:hypothetical protein